MIRKRAAPGIVVAIVLSILSAISVKAASETTLYSFGSQTSDGAEPGARLLNVKGKLYGVTGNGGANCGGWGGCGTVFSFDPRSNAETVLYSFCTLRNCADGLSPHAGLINVNGTLYGTTLQGGSSTGCGYTNGCGTVYAIDPATSTETVIYSFCQKKSCADGYTPFDRLLDINGTLYGTTVAGGSADCNGGVVFSLNPAKHAENVLHVFQCDGLDGTAPVAALSEVNGTLYGVTQYGGAHGLGTVFSIDPATGAETILYSFCSEGGYCPDGEEPAAALINVNGILYGTTEFGSVAYCKRTCGTVFALDLATGAERVLHYFGAEDGRYPEAALIDVNGTLYGTTVYGGSGGGGCYETYGCGTVFSLDPGTGSEFVVYNFCSKKNCRDGALPMSKLIDVKGKLYGTTAAGGSYGQGTIFRISP